MRSPFAPTPAQQWLWRGGVYSPQNPPRNAQRITLVVVDETGLDCEGAKYPLLALRGMDVDLWVTHREAGSFHLVSGGQTTRAGEVLSARFYAGEELTFSATGPDARKALDAFVGMLKAPPEARRGIYRELRRGERVA